MDFRHVVRARRMVRAFQPDRPVSPASLQRILDNAQRAPSAGFSQGAAYVVLRQEQERQRFWTVTAGTRPANDWLARMRQAPVLVVCWSSERRYRERYAENDKAHADPFDVPYWYVDAGMGILLILQTAVDEGLGACLFGIPAQRVPALRAQLGVPEDWLPIGVVALGHPDPSRDRRSPSLRRGRRDPAEVIHMGQWGSTTAGLPPSREE